MSLPITVLIASILTVLYCVFSLRVVDLRRKNRISLGHNENEALKRAMRVHGNFSEYSPLFIVLMILMEMHGVPATWLLGVGSLFILGRLSHAFGIMNGPARLPFRTIGMVITMTCLLGSVFRLLFCTTF